MSKRFTDANKWRNEWFRTLPVKAKLTWVYICDECDFTGVWKCDFGLASFQLDFNVTKQDMVNWFADKIHFFSANKMLIVPFYEFQYGESKDSWTAKAKARQKLETLGFTVKDNTVVLNHSPTTVPPQSKDCLGVGVGVGVVEVNKGGVGEKKELHEIGQLWNLHAPKELARIETTGGKREKPIKKYWPQMTPEQWVETFKRIEKSDWLLGNDTNSRGWRASFDWVIENYAKVKEGNYDRKQTRKNIVGEHLRGAQEVADDFSRIIAEVAGD